METCYVRVKEARTQMPSVKQKDPYYQKVQRDSSRNEGSNNKTLGKEQQKSEQKNHHEMGKNIEKSTTTRHLLRWRTTRVNTGRRAGELCEPALGAEACGTAQTKRGELK